MLGDESLMLNELCGPQNEDGRPRISIRAQDGKDLKQIVKELKREAEAPIIAQALQETNGDRREAAALLKISYKALVYKAHQYSLDLPRRTPGGAAPSPYLKDKAS